MFFITDSLGFRSFGQPSGTVTPPGQRLSIREYDKQLTALRNENFNLKLRIYFLEEKNSGSATNNADGTDSLFKQNIDLKVCIYKSVSNFMFLILLLFNIFYIINLKNVIMFV